MRNMIISVVRWFRRPTVGRPVFKEVLDFPYEPDTVRILVERMEKARAEYLDWADRLDRKLLAVITADGVYAAILASIRDSIPAGVVVLVGAVVGASFFLAYRAWRPQPYGSVPLDSFIPQMNIHPDDLNRMLIVTHSGINHDIGNINRWKAQKLASSAGLFAAAALFTLSVYTW